MILYEGPSLIDGEAVVVIAVEDSNPKTGRMLFTYILLQDLKPSWAVDNRKDAAICGDCPLRQVVPGAPSTRACYVRLTPDRADEKWSVDEVWTAYQKNQWPAVRDVQMASPFELYRYPPVDPGLYRYTGDLSVRLGSYGDPAAVPTDVWAHLLEGVKQWTGYTHQWRTCDPDLQEFCMASVDSVDEMYEARDMGWRCFYVSPSHHTEAWSTDEILCPASSLGGKKTDCEHCMLCMGTSSKASKDIWIPGHGINKELFA